MPTSAISIDVISSANNLLNAKRSILSSLMKPHVFRSNRWIAKWRNQWIGDHLRVAQSDSTQRLRGSHSSRRPHNQKYYSILQAPRHDSRGNSQRSLFEHRRSFERI